MFVVLVLVSFVLMTFDVQSQDSDDILSRFRSGAASLFGPIQAATDSVVDPVAGFIDGIVSVATLRSRNLELAADNEALTAEVAELRTLEVENELLRGLLNLEEVVGVDLPTVLAEVHGVDDGSLTVDKGRNDGISVGYPVLDEAGLLIGRVVAVADRTSTVRLLTESIDVVEVSTATGTRGAVSGLGRAGELRFDVYEEAEAVVPDTLLSTVGTNGYPPGLQVAMVTELIQPIGDQITDARVEPVADFSRIPQFVVILQPAREVVPEEGEGTTTDGTQAEGEGETPAGDGTTEDTGTPTEDG